MLTPAQVMALIAACVETTALTQSQASYWWLRSRSPVHRQFAVAFVNTELPTEKRQRNPLIVQHDCRILWAYQLGAPVGDDRITSEDDALTLECDVITALLALALDGQSLRLAGIRNIQRTAGANGWLWSEISLTLIHAMEV